MIQSVQPMKHIWAPWRMAYIEGEHEDTGCIFCERLAQKDGPENLILHRGDWAFVILNRYPYTNGHLMVVPYDHRPSIEDLAETTLAEMMSLTTDALRVLREAYGASSFNLGINIGEAAGAGVADHIHIHVLPRWNGDTNFMTTTDETRVVPEALEESYRRLQPLWDGSAASDADPAAGDRSSDRQETGS